MLEGSVFLRAWANLIDLFRKKEKFLPSIGYFLMFLNPKTVFQPYRLKVPRIATQANQLMKIFTDLENRSGTCKECSLWKVFAHMECSVYGFGSWSSRTTKKHWKSDNGACNSRHGGPLWKNQVNIWILSKVPDLVSCKHPHS